MTSTSKRLPAISSMARARVSISPRWLGRGSASVEVGGGALGAGPLGCGPLLTGMAEVQEGDEPLLRREADGSPPLGAAQKARGAPVAGVTAGVGREEDDVGGGSGGVQVL